MDVYEVVVEEARRDLIEHARRLSKALDKARGKERARFKETLTLIRTVLKRWDEIEPLLETALVNHRYRILTVPIKRSENRPALFLKFSLEEKDLPRYEGLRIDVDRWPYRWEIHLDKEGARLVEKKRPILVEKAF